MTKALALVSSVSPENPVENDLVLALREGGGKRFVLLTTLPELVAQRLRVRLRFFRGEWFWDRREGIPYVTDVFGNRISSKDVLITLFREVILETPGVANVSEIDFEQLEGRRGVLRFVAILTDGTRLDTLNDPFLVGDV